MTRQHIFDQRLCLRHDKCILVLLPVHLRKIWCKCLCTIFFAKVLVQILAGQRDPIVKLYNKPAHFLHMRHTIRSTHKSSTRF